MKVSVIVPVYNAEKVLHYCIDSILNQTYKDFELILVDDGSTDKSGEICDKYARENDKVTVVHIENSGVSKARNTGIDCAKGEYICFVDSDDYLDKRYLEVLLKTKTEFPDCDNIWCGFQTVSDYNNSDLKTNLVSEKEDVSIFNRTDIMTLHEKWLSQMPWNKLYNSKVISNNNIQFPGDLSLGEDLIFNLEYIDNTNGKIAIINKPIYYYLQTGNETLDNRYYHNLFNIYMRVNSHIFRYLKKWNCNESQLKLYYNSCFFGYEKALHNTFHPDSDIKNKYRFNKQILKSQEFRDSLKNSDCFIHPLYKFCYKTASCRLIRMFDALLT